MQKAPEDHIRCMYLTCKKNQSNCPVCPQLLDLPCISQSAFCSFSFILTCATEVTSATDKSNFKSHDFILEILWGFLYLPGRKLCYNKIFYTACKLPCLQWGAEKEKDILCPHHRKLITWSTVYGDSFSSGLPGVTLPSPTQHKCSAMEAAEVRVGGKVDMTVVMWQKTAGWRPSGAGPGGCTNLCCCAAQSSLQVHWFHRERDRHISLNHRFSLQSWLLGQNLNQQICWCPTAPDLAICCNKP